MVPICPYCAAESKLVTGADLYPHRADLSDLRFWQCKPCDAYVGCHKKESGQGDGTQPLGRLANAELRRAKSQAHAAFDPRWKMRTMFLFKRRSAITDLTSLATSAIPSDDLHLAIDYRL